MSGTQRRSLLARAVASVLVALLGLPVPGLVPPAAASTILRAFTPRFQTTDRGSIAAIGNTLMTCPASALCTSARAGTAATTTDNNNNVFTMAMVDIDTDPSTFDSSSAALAIPAGATVLFAGLYWGAESASVSRNAVKFALPGGSYQSITAVQVNYTGNDYAAVADVTPLVASLADPNGTYRVADVQATVGMDQSAGWTLVVAYRDTLTPAPLRNLTVFDGYAVVNTTPVSDLTTTVSGFLTPASGTVNAEVGLVSFEGDLGWTGDQFRLNGANISDATHPLGNSFDSAISTLGTRVTTKTPDYVNQLGFDINLFDGTGHIPNSANSASLTFTTSQDVYYPTVLTFAVDVFQPRLVAPKAQRDVNGGVLKIGDQIEYTVDVTNLGNDPSVDTVMTDPIPAGTIFVPGSASIVSGANTGPITDAAGDDTGEFVAAADQLVVRLGSGANTTTGGRMDYGATIRVRFRVTVAGGIPPGTRIQNQANLSYRGLTLGTLYAGVTDADDGAAGDQPTDMTLNLAPTANDDTATTPEDTPVTVDVAANDADPDWNLDPRTVTVTANPSNGVATVSASTGVVTYTPDPDWHGGDPFTYRICDDAGDCDTAVATVTVTSVNDPPAATDDDATTDEDTPVGIPILANDRDPDGSGDLDRTSLTVTSGPASGSVAIDRATGVATYTPDPDWNGDDSFTYQVCDAAAVCATAVAHVTVTPVNDPPSAHADSQVTQEDTSTTVAVLANDSDPDGLADLDPGSVVVTVPALHGTTAVDPLTGAVTYVPGLDYNGPDAFSYRVCDLENACALAQVTLDVGPLDDPPVAVDDDASVDEDASVAVDVLANDSDVEDGLVPSTVGVTSGPAHGAALAAATGVVTYTPAPDYNGADSFMYQVCDDAGSCVSATVSVTVRPVNDAPTAADDAATTAEDTPVTVDVVANDADVDGDVDPSTVQVTGPPAHGGTSVDPVTGEITYTPAADWHGSDSLTYRVCDDVGVCAHARLDLAVAAVNDPPVAGDDSATVAEDNAVTVDVLANDTDPEANLDPASVTIASGPTIGTATVDPVTGAITYTPAPNANGPDSLVYQVCDSAGACSIGTLHLSVTPAADPPIGVDDLAPTAEDTPVTIDVLANDIDPDANLDPDSVSVTSGPAHGSVSILPATGAIRYLPDANWFGTDTLRYRVCDSGLPVACSSATVTLEVSSVDDLPSVVPDAATTAEDTPATIDVLANDTDTDGIVVPGSITLIVPPAHGTSAIDPVTGAIAYAPDPDWHGTDTFTYQVCDDQLGCAQANVTVSVSPVPDPPVAGADVATTTEDMAVVVDVLANDGDVDGNLDPTSVAVTASPSHGTPTVDPLTGAITYTPDPDYAGPDTLSYRVCDSGVPVACATAAVALTVAGVNDPPTAAPDTVTTLEDVPVTLDPLANDADADGALDPASVAIAAGPARGSVSVDPVTGRLTYTPEPDWNGVAPFTYRVCDDLGACATAGVTVTVGPVDDPPVAVADGVTLPEDTPARIDVLANDRDADGPADLDPSSVRIVGGPAHGSATVDPLSGAVTYTPAPDANGPDSFTYQVCDRSASCASAVVSLSVTPTRDGPRPAPDAATMPEDVPVTVDVVANDRDPDGDLDPASVSIADGPDHGTARVDATTGAVTYAPAPDWNGPDAFTYQVCDALAACATTTVTLTVSPVNDPPAATDDNALTPEDSPVAVDVLANDTDPDGGADLVPASVRVTRAPAHGMVRVDHATGTLTYVPGRDWNGLDTFAYTVCDAAHVCTAARVAIDVTPVNDPPVPVNDAVVIAVDQTALVDVLGNDTDPDGNLDPASVAITSQPAHGTITVDPASGRVTYVPESGFAGTDHFTYRVCDSDGACQAAGVTVVASVPATFTWIGPDQQVVQVPGWCAAAVGAYTGFLIAFLVDRRRRRRAWRRMLRRVAAA